MHPLSKKLLLNKKIALEVPDYNSYHKMCRLNDFKEIFILCEDLFFDIAKFSRQNSSSKNLQDLINVKRKILVIDDSSEVATDYWQRVPVEIHKKSSLPDDLSEYWAIVEILFKTNESIFPKLKLEDDQCCISLISQNNSDQLKNSFFKDAFKVSYANKTGSWRISGLSSNLMGKEKFLMKYGPWPRPQKDWESLVELPIPQHILDLFKVKS